MPNLRLPIPMLSPLGWGSSSDFGLPDNVNVLAALESFEENVHAIESYKAISLFCHSKQISSDTPQGRRPQAYPESLERILNWSLIVCRKSIFDWAPEDIKNCLSFLEAPDASWIASASHSRFVLDRRCSDAEWQLNEAWRPFRRVAKKGAFIEGAHWSRLDMERNLILGLFEFLASNTSCVLPNISMESINQLRDSIPRKRPARADRRAHSEGLPRLHPHELDWIFGITAELRSSNWYYNIILFAMAVMRYTDIPLRALCRGYGHTGTLSQFKIGADNIWRFTDHPGLASEKIYKLNGKMEVYLKMHADYLGVPFEDELPDADIFTRPGSGHGFGYYYLLSLMTGFRDEICQLIENSNYPDAFARKDIFMGLSFTMIRRSRKRGRPRRI
ncbi:hypothetical protein [Pseudomonas juntendi]|uniref:hypothetical protein n=1 Tax=Pseudomonas juntendi TaxID=2666183 RepID=UPI00320A4D0F